MEAHRLLTTRGEARGLCPQGMMTPEDEQERPEAYEWGWTREVVRGLWSDHGVSGGFEQAMHHQSMHNVRKHRVGA